MFDTPLNSNDQSLDRVLKAGLPVALVFVNGGAALNDTLNRLAREHAGQLLVVKVKAAENPASARRFGVGGTPAVVTVRHGEAQSKAERVSAADVEQHVAYLLGRGPKPAQRERARTAERPAGGGAGAGAPHGAAGGRPIDVTEATFEQMVLRASEPVLIDFWAPWCGPCHMVAPVVEKLAREYAGRLRVAKVNVDENPGLSVRYGVQGIPAMMVFKNGQVADRWVGAMPEPAIRSRVMRALNGG